MNRFTMATGEYRLPSLGEFTVTVTDHTPKQKPTITWDEFYALRGFNVDFNMEGDDRNILVFKTEKEPEDFVVEMPYNDPPYELVWAK